MNGKVIALALLLSLATPLTGHAEPAGILEGVTVTELGLVDNNPDTVLKNGEGSKLEKTAVAAATGAAIGSVWPGPGTVIGLLVGGAYGFFFK